MIRSISYKSKHFLALLLKASILILLVYFVYQRLSSHKELTWQSFQQLGHDTKLWSLPIIGFLLLQSTLNWILEVFKWKTLANQIEKINWLKAIEQSLGSHSVSLITPNRIGEYGAKALYYHPSQWKKVMSLNFIGNFTQLLVTLIFGLIAAFYFLFEVSLPKLLENQIENSIVISTVVILATLLLAIFLKSSFGKPYINQLKNTLQLSTGFIFTKILGLSLLRYLVFSHQFFFLIWLAVPEANYISAIFGVSLIYLIASLIPMLSFFDFVIKGSVGVLILGFLSYPSTHILLIALLMWILNFALPAFLGTFYVFKYQWQRS